MLDETSASAVTTVLRELDAALTAGEAAAAAALFEPDGFWRDLVSVTWSITTLEGRDLTCGDAGGATAARHATRLDDRSRGASR